MLRITVSESSEAAKRYFSQSLSRGDYYFDGQEIAGMWGGEGATRLGLIGQVEREAFLKLIDNLRPNGSRLTARTNLNRRPGYDFTFDVPKSVSLLHAMTRDERIPEAMRLAVVATMREIEQEMHARVRKDGAFEDRPTHEMLWADFTHLTTRPTYLTREQTTQLISQNPELIDQCDANGCLSLPDPHLHMHVFAINATYDAVENIWKAGEFMRIKRDAPYYQAAYHTRLAGELQKLGYAIEPTARAFEVAGVPRDIIEVFSRRTKEVEKMARALGIKDANAKAQLGRATRQSKDSALSMSELRTLWAGIAGRNEGDRLSNVAGNAKSAMQGIARDEPQSARVGFQYAIGREFERASEISERRLLATALERSVGRASIATVRGALPTIPGLVSASVGGDPRLTTVQILREESALKQAVKEGHQSEFPLVVGRYHFKLPMFAEESAQTKEQRDAVLHVLRSKDRIVGVIGRAGTGKTTMLKEVAEGIREAGRKLIICAPTAEAARGVLRGEGFAQADTVKRLLTDAYLQSQLTGGVLWVDEAGMLGNRDLLALIQLAKERGAARVVLAGDPTQIRSVPRGDALRFLEERAGLAVARLEKIRRQKTPELKEAVDALSRGEANRALTMLDKHGAIIEADTQASRTTLAKAYVERIASRGAYGRSRSVLVVSPTHREGEAVTRAIREELREAGKLGSDEISIPRTVNLAWTESEKGNPAAYEMGMVVQFKQHLPGFRKSERVRVADIDTRGGAVCVRKNDGTTAQLPLARAKDFQVYRLDELRIARGDQLRITENGCDKTGAHRFDNGALVVVDGITPTGDIDVGSGRILPQHFGHLNYGYVVTADAAQAKTVDTVLAAIGSDSMTATDMRRFYVTVSRAREEVLVFTDDKEALQQSVSRDSERRFASEVVGAERANEILTANNHRAISREEHARKLMTSNRQREAQSQQSAPRHSTQQRVYPHLSSTLSPKHDRGMELER